MKGDRSRTGLTDGPTPPPGGKTTVHSTRVRTLRKPDKRDRGRKESSGDLASKEETRIETGGDKLANETFPITPNLGTMGLRKRRALQKNKAQAGKARVLTLEHVLKGRQVQEECSRTRADDTRASKRKEKPGRKGPEHSLTLMARTRQSFCLPRRQRCRSSESRKGKGNRGENAVPGFKEKAHGAPGRGQGKKNTMRETPRGTG